MSPPQKRRRNDACVPTTSRTLPEDLLLEIAARSDVGTLIRCTVACKTLRRSILTATFIQQQAAGLVPARILARLHTPRRNRGYRPHKPLISLVHPATPVASSFVDNHLAPFVGRHATDLLRQYGPVSSRGGLILLRRRSRRHLIRYKSSSYNMCVYDPLTNTRTFLSDPPGISMDDGSFIKSCVLLNSADGISCSSFLLLVADMSIGSVIMHDGRHTVRIQTASSSDADIIRWGPVTEYLCNSGPFQDHSGPVVLPGGVIHWLPLHKKKILTYDVRTKILAIVRRPLIPGQHHLAMSPDGKLRILAVHRFVISMWLQHSADCWEPEAMIDVEEKMRSIDPHIPSHGLGLARLKLWCSGERKSNAVVLWVCGVTIVLDLVTKEMREDSTSSFPLEFDLSARLQAMKDFL